MENLVQTFLAAIVGSSGVGGFFWWLIKRHIDRIDDLDRSCARKTEVDAVSQRIDKEMDRIYERELKDMRALHTQEVRDLRQDMNGIATQLRSAITETKQDINQKLDMIVELVKKG